MACTAQKVGEFQRLNAACECSVHPKQCRTGPLSMSKWSALSQIGAGYAKQWLKFDSFNYPFTVRLEYWCYTVFVYIYIHVCYVYMCDQCIHISG